MIPYGRQQITEEDIQEVVDVLRSDWLTQGPVVERFEQAVAQYCNAKYAVAVANGTAALHLASLAAGFKPEDEVITSPITFVASANCIVYTGATPVFADIDPRTYCIDPQQIQNRITKKAKGIIPVHFAGQPCDMEAIAELARARNLIVIEDAAHAIGASYQAGGKTCKVGSCAHSDMTIFSFHPVKHITTGEGGIITTNNRDLYEKLCQLRTHGITRDPARLKQDHGPWYYEQQQLGFNYRITDFQCALGLSQLKRLDQFIARRKEIITAYNSSFADNPNLVTPFQREGTDSSWHLYMLGLKDLDRAKIFHQLRENGIGVNVHYIPVHLQPYFQEKYNLNKGDHPHAESYYESAVTMPLFPDLTDDEVSTVIATVTTVIQELNQ